VNDFKGIENAATASEARDAAGRPHPRGARAGDIESAMMRYLAAEQYHEKVEESREAEEAEQDTSH
jgi:hypothetical protein